MPAKLSIVQMRALAASRGGQCLSRQYQGSEKKLKWLCSEGHVWWTTPKGIRRGTWCPNCARAKSGSTQRLKLSDAKLLARGKRGRLLSKSYVNSNSKLHWRCESGHDWYAPVNNIKSGSWCPKCAGRAPLTISDLSFTAATKNGKCLSLTHPGSHKNAKWQCSAGHIFYATPSNVRSGKWCPHCAGRRRTIAYFQKLAISRRGKCLSKSYLNSMSKLIWECASGHRWKAVPMAVVRGSWCPTCTSGISERMVRVTMEKIFGSPFPKVRPKWLLGSKGYPLELDGYNHALKLAFEHQGRQHSRSVDYFDRVKNSFNKRTERDAEKRAVCARRGIRLVEVPEIGSALPLKELQSFILAACKVMKVKVPNGAERVKIDYGDTFIGENVQRYLVLKKIAKDRGGTVLSKSYFGSRMNHRWRCRKNHEWENSVSNIKRGQWCPYCAGQKSLLDIHAIRNFAKRQGGELLSSTMTGISSKLKFKCKMGHTFSKASTDIVKGKFCPKCSRISAGVKRRIGFEKAREIALKKGGRCLSTSKSEYRDRMKWKCSKGHLWEAAFINIRSGCWCPECARATSAAKRRTPISEIKRLARLKGGVCLSKSYDSSQEKLDFRCKRGHRWKARFAKIKIGQWCPQCSRKRRET